MRQAALAPRLVAAVCAVLFMVLQAGLAAGADPVWRVLAADDHGLRLELTLPAADVRARDDVGAGVVELWLPDAVTAGAEGAPALPALGRLVAVPAGATVSGRVVAWDAQRRDGLDLAAVHDGADAPYARDGDAYARAGWRGPLAADDARLLPATAKAVLPAPQVAVGATAIMAGQTVAALTVAPVLYDAAARSAVICRRVEIELSFAGAKAAARTRALPRSFAALAADQVLGLPADKTLPTGADLPGLWVAVARNNPDVLSRLQPLLDWRRQQGYEVEVVDADAAGNTAIGIKAALQSMYDDPGRAPLEFVCLVGDASGTWGVPPWFEAVSGFNGEGDHYYGTFEGDDILADAHVGRLSFGTLDQLSLMVGKIVGYEQAPPMDDTDWFGHASVMGDPSASGITTIWTNQWLKTQLLNLGWAKVDTTWSGSFSARLLETVNPGASVFAYRGYYNMSGITTGHIGYLTNGGRLPVALLPTCDTGSFTAAECRSESWLRAPGGGGVAAVGTATIHTHTRYNNAYFQGAWAGLLYGADHRVGAGHTAGKLRLYANYFIAEPGEAETWSVWNSLMGDPATDMWVGVPRVLDVTAAATLPAGATSLPVTVESEGAPVAGALVCALDANGKYWRGLTDDAGQVTLSGGAQTAGDLALTVSGHGLLPHRATVTVGAAADFCGVDGVVIVDDGTQGSAGNGDGLPNPGETLALLPTLTNFGSNPAADVTATLSGGGPLATVAAGALAYGALAPAQSAAPAAPALVTVAADAEDRRTVRLDLTAVDGGASWDSALNLDVRAPHFAVTGLTVGSADGDLDPGEAATLVLELGNLGRLAGDGVTAVLTMDSPWVSVVQANGSFGTIAAGAVGTNAGQPFFVSAATDCYGGHLAAGHLDLLSNGAMVGRCDFALTVGAGAADQPTGPDAYGYYAFDDTDTASGLAPTYDWVPVAPGEGGAGESVALTDFGWEQDDTRTVDLPFTFRYYGQDFDRISICSNGWAALGDCSLVGYRNFDLPGSAGGPRAMLAPFWDNLYQTGENRVYHWYDEADGRYIVEWYNMPNDYADSRQTFQLILLDPLFHQTTTGEGIIVFQYAQVHNTDARDAYATVGIQSPDGRDGLMCSFWNQSMAGAAPIAAGRAIRFMPRGTVVTPAAQVAPAGVTVSVLPDGQTSGALQIGNVGDPGSQLLMHVAKFDPLVLAGKQPPAGDLGLKGLTGSKLTLAEAQYDVGLTMDLHVDVTSLTQGQEWILFVRLQAPPGVTVNTSTPMTGGSSTMPTNGATGDGALVQWGGSGHLDNNQTGTATVNVTFGAGLEGDLDFDWELIGDEWGEPPHQMYGTAILAATGPYILVNAPVSGATAVLGQPLTVDFDAFNGPTAVDIDLQREVGGAWESLASSVPAASGTWTWPAVTGTAGPYARVRVRDAADPQVDKESDVFAVSRDLSWLQPAATQLVVPSGETAPLTLDFDATGLAEGVYEAVLLLQGNGGAPTLVPVTMTVTSTSAAGEIVLPAQPALLGNWPNPFNPATTIRYAVPRDMDARLDVYTVRGRLVRRLVDGRVTAGLHDAVWDGRDAAGRTVASGVYFYRLATDEGNETGKMILTK